MSISPFVGNDTALISSVVSCVYVLPFLLYHLLQLILSESFLATSGFF